MVSGANYSSALPHCDDTRSNQKDQLAIALSSLSYFVRNSGSASGRRQYIFCFWARRHNTSFWRVLMRHYIGLLDSASATAAQRSVVTNDRMVQSAVSAAQP